MAIAIHSGLYAAITAACENIVWNDNIQDKRFPEVAKEAQRLYETGSTVRVWSFSHLGRPAGFADRYHMVIAAKETEGEFTCQVLGVYVEVIGLSGPKPIEWERFLNRNALRFFLLEKQREAGQKIEEEAERRETVRAYLITAPPLLVTIFLAGVSLFREQDSLMSWGVTAAMLVVSLATIAILWIRQDRSIDKRVDFQKSNNPVYVTLSYGLAHL